MLLNPAPSLALVIADLEGGGAQRVLVNMLAEWHNRGHKLTLVTFSRGKEEFFKPPQGVDYRPLNLSGNSTSKFTAIINNIYRVRVLRKELKAINADIVISFVGVTNILTILATMFLGMNVVISERNDPSRQSIGRIWDFLRRIIYPKAKVVTANSDAAVNSMARYIPQSKLMIVPNPVIVPKDIKPTIFDGPQFLAVGRLHAQKAYDVLLKALALSKARKCGWGLTVLGDGPKMEEMRILSDELGVNDLVRWEGLVHNPFEYYVSASAYVLPSRHEGMPNALLEAMSMGLPSIISDALEGPKNLIINATTGWVVEVGNAYMLANTMNKIMENPKKAKTIGEQGKLKVLKKMSLSSAVSSWDMVFNKCIESQ